MWKSKYQRYNKGFTLTELIVTIAIIGTLAGVGTIALTKVRSTNQQTTCVNNLRAISQGLQMYYNDYMIFPDDSYPTDGYSKIEDKPSFLSTELADYINKKSTFVCPVDDDPISTAKFASYDPYYVARKGSYDSNELAIGCPRHMGSDRSTTLFSTGSTEITKIGKVLANGVEVPPDGATVDRTISNVGDKMSFDDGSIVEITQAQAGYGTFLIQSVQLSDGTLYSIIKTQDDGTIDVQVTSGSKFEIVTPSAIVGVRGTHFTVTTSNGGNTTDVTIDTGTVTVQDRTTGETTTLTDGSPPAEIKLEMHSHWHTHTDGTKHKHSHPSENQAHHGKPGAGEDDESSGSEDDESSDSDDDSSGSDDDSS